MAGTRAVRANRAALVYLRHRRVVLFVAAVLWSACGAGVDCIAGSPRVDSAQASQNVDSAEGPLLTADARFTTAPAGEPAHWFHPNFPGPATSQSIGPNIGTFDGASPILLDSAVIDPSLHVYLPANDFRDTDPGTVTYSMSGLDVDSDRSVAGGRMQLITATGDRGRTLAEARLSWLFEYLQTESGSTSFFSPGDKAIFAVQGLNYGSNWALVGAGLRWELFEGFSAQAGYDAQVNSQQFFHIGSGGLRYVW